MNYSVDQCIQQHANKSQQLEILYLHLYLSYPELAHQFQHNPIDYRFANVVATLIKKLRNNLFLLFFSI